MTIALCALAWLVCFIFAWGYVWKYAFVKGGIQDEVALVATTFVMTVMAAPLIVVGVPLGKLAIKISKKVYGL